MGLHTVYRTATCLEQEFSMLCFHAFHTDLHSPQAAPADFSNTAEDEPQMEAATWHVCVRSSGGFLQAGLRFRI